MPHFVSLIALSAIAACSGADARNDSGAREGKTSSSRIALDTSRLANAYERASKLPRLRSFIVQWKDSVVREEYYGAGAADRRTNIKSASKSIISALTGIAMAQGKIRGTDQTIGELLPAETRGLDSLKRSITVGELLSMQAGLEPTSFGNYGGWVQSSNWVRNALSRPMVAEPGGRMLYSTGSTHLLSAIITRATGMSTHRFAQEHFAEPLGIELGQWPRDPQGIYFGGNDMYLTPRDMLKIGALYLHRGEIEGRRIVPSAWVDSSFVPRTVSPFNGNRYGYGWWMRSAGGQAIHYAWGYGGQFIFVVPGMDLVVVMTSDADATRDGGHNRELHRILEEEIISPGAVR
ncbi:MAG: serine hydrolase domain-containing protein [Gemmatimonadaceae bacterium]